MGYTGKKADYWAHLYINKCTHKETHRPLHTCNGLALKEVDRLNQIMLYKSVNDNTVSGDALHQTMIHWLLDTLFEDQDISYFRCLSLISHTHMSIVVKYVHLSPTLFLLTNSPLSSGMSTFISEDLAVMN